MAAEESEASKRAVWIAVVGAVGAVLAALAGQLSGLVSWMSAPASAGTEASPGARQSPSATRNEAVPKASSAETSAVVPTSASKAPVPLLEQVKALRSVLANAVSTPAERQESVVALLELSREKMVELQNEGIAAADLAKGYQGKLNLRGTNFDGKRLDSMNLPDADLQGASLRRASLRKAQMPRANLRWSRLDGSRFDGANLKGAEFEGATFGTASFKRADLRSADLSLARGLTAQQLSDTCWDAQTKFPPSVSPEPASCAVDEATP